MMKMKYQDHMQHLSAILTIAMVCIQTASSVYGAYENGALEGHHTESQSLVHNLTNDQLNSMTVSELKELNLEVTQELKQKHEENLNGTIQLRTDN
jgi:hypothetical protein